jgi:hypothetical protein
MTNLAAPNKELPKLKLEPISHVMSKLDSVAIQARIREVARREMALSDSVASAQRA